MLKDCRLKVYSRYTVDTVACCPILFQVLQNCQSWPSFSCTFTSPEVLLQTWKTWWMIPLSFASNALLQDLKRISPTWDIPVPRRLTQEVKKHGAAECSWVQRNAWSLRSFTSFLHFVGSETLARSMASQVSPAVFGVTRGSAQRCLRRQRQSENREPTCLQRRD